MENLVGLYCIVPRDQYSTVYDAILESGAPGVSTNFGVMIDADDSEDGQHQNEEWALVYTSVGPNSVDSIRESIQTEVENLGIDHLPFIPYQFQLLLI